jgi:ubiquinone/menaquinone biosynthesis C-methylase UbiE
LSHSPDPRTHDRLVAVQFGDQAEAYLRSATHAAGADLTALAGLVAGAPGADVLDLGCGGGHVGFAVAPHVASVTACDLSPAMLDVVAKEAVARGLPNLRTVEGAAEHLPFPDASFDFVLSRYSAHHWGDLDAGLRETWRVLRPGGMAGFADVVSPGRARLDTWLQTLELLRDPSHVRNRSRAEWEEALARAGFLPGTATGFRLSLGFGAWIERMRTPAAQVAAIRALQTVAPDDIRAHFEIEADGSFTVDTALLTVRRPG